MFNIFSYMLTNGSLLFSSVTPSGMSQDPGLYNCIAEVTERGRAHRIATPQVQLSLAGKLLFYVSYFTLYRYD